MNALLDTDFDHLYVEVDYEATYETVEENLEDLEDDYALED